MFNTIKSYLTIISLAIAVLSAGYSFFMKVKADALKAERDNAVNELEVKTTEVTKYKNELGQEVTKTIEYSKKLSQLKDSKDSVERKLYATISASKVKEKQLQKAISLQIEASNKQEYDSVVYVEPVYEELAMEMKSVPVEIAPINYNEIRYFNDGFLNAVSFPDSLSYTYKEEINIITAKRMVPRKFFLWRWVGWKKMVDRDLVEIVSNNPRSNINGRMIRIKK